MLALAVLLVALSAPVAPDKPPKPALPSCLRTQTALRTEPVGPQPSPAAQETHVIMDHQLKACRIVHTSPQPTATG